VCVCVCVCVIELLGPYFRKSFEGRQFITNRTARTQDNKNVGRKPVTHWHRREREKKRERERKLKGRKRREGGHGSAEARKAEGQAEM
jgi:hypothetical protein